MKKATLNNEQELHSDDALHRMESALSSEQVSSTVSSIDDTDVEIVYLDEIKEIYIEPIEIPTCLSEDADTIDIDLMDDVKNDENRDDFGFFEV